MTPLGWLFLIASLAFVWGLTLWCFHKVLSVRDEPPETWESRPSGVTNDAPGRAGGRDPLDSAAHD